MNANDEGNHELIIADKKRRLRNSVSNHIDVHYHSSAIDNQMMETFTHTYSHTTNPNPFFLIVGPGN